MAADSLIKLGGNLENPRDCKASDFPAVGPSGAAGMSSGDNQLVKQTFNQEGPQHSQDDGEHTQAKWGKAEWTVGKASEGSTAVKCDWAVDFESGQSIPNVATDY